MEWFKKHKIITAIIVVFIIAIAANSSGSNTSDTNNKSSDSEQVASPANENEKEKETVDELAKIGTAVRDGKFEFTVNSLKCGEKTVGTNEYLQDNATGHFCRMNMTIKNIGNEAQSLFGDNQKLIDNQNREFSYDSSATIYAAPSGSSGSTWFDQINPGNSVTGDLIFDVPIDATIVTAELHDSSFSNGVKVDVKQ